MALLIRGSKPDPSRVRQVPQITRVRDCMGVPYKRPLNAEFEMPYAVFEACRVCLAGGSHRGRAPSPRILSNGSEPRLANPCERLCDVSTDHNPTLTERGTDVHLNHPDKSSLKQPWLAARAWVAWCASPLLPVEGRRGSKTKVEGSLNAFT